MCEFASFIITKDREFWSETDNSHTTIIRENNLHEDGPRGPNIIRVEISPTNKIKVWPSLKAWKYKVDQDILPEWHIPETTEKRARAALARRAKAGFQSVYASGCTALTELKADSAQTVYANGCTALTELKADKATYVYARGCTALTELKADKATYVDASGCTAKLVVRVKKGATVIR